MPDPARRPFANFGTRPRGGWRSMGLVAVFRGGHAEPALARRGELRGCFPPEQVRHAGGCVPVLVQVVLRKFTAHAVEQFVEAVAFGFQAPVEGDVGHAETAGDLVAPRLAQVQPADDLLTGAVAGARTAET